ncbi:hypothetical protein Bhyg_07264 [Pseudolycoriella hygida]|uniref:Uncharacterized protein n=1 Tax=Pseudolycoriella hygida TaxID=35572 RepID=A0A9Q0N3C6_9DIPT|nr:hypothetical protein Bhyg_07264 [Pseudolycoriella hygida]
MKEIRSPLAYDHYHKTRHLEHPLDKTHPFPRGKIQIDPASKLIKRCHSESASQADNEDSSEEDVSMVEGELSDSCSGKQKKKDGS